MFTTTAKSDGDEAALRWPALHIRAIRELYGEAGLSSAELADLAGISEPALARFGVRRTLPASVEDLLRIAFALQVSVEELIDPELLVELRAGIAERRAEREGGSERREIGFRRRWRGDR